MTQTLLPVNRTALETAADEAQGVRMEGIQVPLRDLWNPDACPAAILPWLAWALSVDEWDPGWTETQQRQVIKNSIFIHRHKGTRGAVEAALASLGFAVTVTEWWEKDPKGTPYTFDLNILMPAGYSVDQDAYAKAERVVMAAKNTRSHLGSITLEALVISQVPTYSAAAIGGDTITVYPLGRIGIGDDV